MLIQLHRGLFQVLIEMFLKSEDGQAISTKPFKQIQPLTLVTLVGPLVNIQGQVIGITSSKIASNGGTSVVRSWFCNSFKRCTNIIKQLEVMVK